MMSKRRERWRTLLWNAVSEFKSNLSFMNLRKSKETKKSEKIIIINDCSFDAEHQQFEFAEENSGIYKNKRSVSLNCNRSCPGYVFIDDKMENVINHSLMNGISVQHYGVQITLKEVKQLYEGRWVNDNIIDLYLCMIQMRSMNSKGNFLKVYCFSIFYSMEIAKGKFKKICHYTRREKLHEKDLLYFPVNINENHWALIVVNVKLRSISWCCSFGSFNNFLLEKVFGFLKMKFQKEEYEYNPSSWSLISKLPVPLQRNMIDCGLFLMKNVEFSSRGSDLSYTQNEMRYFRHRMIYEIIKKDLIYP